MSPQRSHLVSRDLGDETTGGYSQSRQERVDVEVAVHQCGEEHRVLENIEARAERGAVEAVGPACVGQLPFEQGSRAIRRKDVIEGESG